MIKLYRGEIVKYTCPCCGYKTLDEEPPNTYDICEICFWEDDGFQYNILMKQVPIQFPLEKRNKILFNLELKVKDA